MSEKNVGSTAKFVVTEKRLENKKSVKFKDDGTIEWCNSANSGTIFDTIEDANQIVEKYFGEDNFGLCIYKVYRVKGQDGKYRWSYRLKNGEIEIGYKQLKLSEVTEKTIRLNVGKNLVKKYLASESLMYQHRAEIKRYAFTSINKLINLHNVTDVQYARTATLISQQKDLHCQGCIICDHIEEYVKLIEHPAMSKFYGHIIGDERGRFVEFIKKNKGIKVEDYGDEQLNELAYLFRDFVALRKQEYPINTIAEFLGCGKNRFFKFYDALVGSKYCWAVGRNKRVFQSDKDFTRRKIDPQF